jgi:hypothetical protein
MKAASLQASGSTSCTTTLQPAINAQEVYVLEEAARRLRWRRHSIRQALRNGLATAKFGSRRYVTGQAVLEFVEKLAEQQAKPQDH